MHRFIVTIRTAADRSISTVSAVSSMSAYMAASEANGDEPCAITVMPVGSQ